MDSSPLFPEKSKEYIPIIYRPESEILEFQEEFIDINSLLHFLATLSNVPRRLYDSHLIIGIKDPTPEMPPSDEDIIGIDTKPCHQYLLKLFGKSPLNDQLINYFLPPPIVNYHVVELDQTLRNGKSLIIFKVSPNFFYKPSFLLQKLSIPKAIQKSKFKSFPPGTVFQRLGRQTHSIFPPGTVFHRFGRQTYCLNPQQLQSLTREFEYMQPELTLDFFPQMLQSPYSYNILVVTCYCPTEILSALALIDWNLIYFLSTPQKDDTVTQQKYTDFFPTYTDNLKVPPYTCPDTHLIIPLTASTRAGIFVKVNAIKKPRHIFPCAITPVLIITHGIQQGKLSQRFANTLHCFSSLALNSLFLYDDPYMISFACNPIEEHDPEDPFPAGPLDIYLPAENLLTTLKSFGISNHPIPNDVSDRNNSIYDLFQTIGVGGVFKYQENDPNIASVSLPKFPDEPSSFTLGKSPPSEIDIQNKVIHKSADFNRISTYIAQLLDKLIHLPTKIVISGPPGSGKSTILVLLQHHFASQGFPTVLFSSHNCTLNSALPSSYSIENFDPVVLKNNPHFGNRSFLFLIDDPDFPVQALYTKLIQGQDLKFLFIISRSTYYPRWSEYSLDSPILPVGFKNHFNKVAEHFNVPKPDHFPNSLALSSFILFNRPLNDTENILPNSSSSSNFTDSDASTSEQPTSTFTSGEIVPTHDNQDDDLTLPLEEDTSGSDSSLYPKLKRFVSELISTFQNDAKSLTTIQEGMYLTTFTNRLSMVLQLSAFVSHYSSGQLTLPRSTFRFSIDTGRGCTPWDDGTPFNLDSHFKHFPLFNILFRESSQSISIIHPIIASIILKYFNTNILEYFRTWQDILLESNKSDKYIQQTFAKLVFPNHSNDKFNSPFVEEFFHNENKFSEFIASVDQKLKTDQFYNQCVRSMIYVAQDTKNTKLQNFLFEKARKFLETRLITSTDEDEDEDDIQSQTIFLLAILLATESKVLQPNSPPNNPNHK